MDYTIRDNAGMKKWHLWATATKGSLGIFTDTLFTLTRVDAIRITDIYCRYTAGTLSGSIFIVTNDGSHSYWMAGAFTPAVNVNIGGVVNCLLEYPDVIQISANVATQPFTYEISMYGDWQVSGEGGLD